MELVSQSVSCVLDASHSGQGPVAGCCEHGNEPSSSIKAGNFLNSSVIVGFSRRTLLHGANQSAGRSISQSVSQLFSCPKLQIEYDQTKPESIYRPSLFPCRIWSKHIVLIRQTLFFPIQRSNITFQLTVRY